MDTRKFSMNYGAYLGLGLIVISFFVWEYNKALLRLLNEMLKVGYPIYSQTRVIGNLVPIMISVLVDRATEVFDE